MGLSLRGSRCRELLTRASDRYVIPGRREESNPEIPRFPDAQSDI
jgi:hypothetical protein